MSTITKNFPIVFKDGADPSTSTATTSMGAAAFSEVFPLQRSFMGEIHIFFSAGRVGTFFMQYSLDEGSSDDEGVERINSNNVVTNWQTHSSVSIGSTDDVCRISLADIGAKWGRVYWAYSSGSTGGVISSSRANLKGF
mgnify:CR=1 FL=1